MPIYVIDPRGLVAELHYGSTPKEHAAQLENVCRRIMGGELGFHTIRETPGVIPGIEPGRSTIHDLVRGIVQQERILNGGEAPDDWRFRNGR